MFFKKILSAALLSAFAVWFFASVPTSFHPAFSQVQDITNFSTEHVSYKYNAAGVLFQEISFGGVIERFVVHFAEGLVFSVKAGAAGIDGEQGIDLFSLVIHDFKEKLFSPIVSFYFKTIFFETLLFSSVLILSVFSKESFAILSILARSRLRGSVSLSSYAFIKNKYFLWFTKGTCFFIFLPERSVGSMLHTASRVWEKSIAEISLMQSLVLPNKRFKLQV